MNYPPSLTLSKGQAVAWSFATSYTLSGNNPGNSTGVVHATSGGIAAGAPWSGTTGLTATWTGFTAPALPSHATILEIYGVAIATDQTGPTPLPTGLNTGPSMGFPTTPYNNVTVIGASLGTSLGYLPGATFTAFAGNSLPANTEYPTFTGYEFLGIAVVYTPFGTNMNPVTPPPRMWVRVGTTKAL